MEEATPEIDQQRVTFEKSQKMKEILDKTVAATIKIGGSIARVIGDVFTSIFKR